MQEQDAAKTLADVQRTQAGALERLLVPAWYWVAVALGMVIVGLVADTGQETAIVVAALVFAAAVAIVTFALIFGVAAGARLSERALGNEGGALITGFVLVTVGLSLGAAFGSRALGFGYPGTLGTAVGAVLLIVCGPWLTRRLRRLMIANVGGSR